jgi:pimeloyl-ACP methyl ester carboxylesterase
MLEEIRSPVCENGISEEIQLRVHNGGCARVIVYLPGSHGDWTLAGGFRRALGTAISFVELTYPRTTTWSLCEYATHVANALRQARVGRAWLLGESFGSQIIWELLKKNDFVVEGVILAGGFARHPFPWMPRAGAALMFEGSLPLLRMAQFAYVQSAKFRFRHSPETRNALAEFSARRTKEDYQAIRHRLRLIGNNDPRPMICRLQTPIYALTGLVDPIVPWPFARRWLKRYCPSLVDYKIIRKADHNVLGTAPDLAAKQVLEWLSASQRTDGSKQMADSALVADWC